jgi:predicted DNA-binding protein (MmcQ/YjbR family)
VTPPELDAACRRLPGVTMVVQWGGSHVYKVGARIFAVLGLGPADALSIKVSEIAYEALTASGAAKPAPYLARAGWVRFDDLADLDPGEGRGLIDEAHRLVAGRLTRKARAELGLA